MVTPSSASRATAPPPPVRCHYSIPKSSRVISMTYCSHASTAGVAAGGPESALRRYLPDGAHTRRIPSALAGVDPGHGRRRAVPHRPLGRPPDLQQPSRVQPAHRGRRRARHVLVFPQLHRIAARSHHGDVGPRVHARGIQRFAVTPVTGGTTRSLGGRFLRAS